MKAGEGIEINFTLNFVSDEIAHDWSVVAYGSKGALTLTHNNNVESDSPRFLAK